MNVYRVNAEQRSMGWVAWVEGFTGSVNCQPTKEVAQRRAVMHVLQEIGVAVLTNDRPWRGVSISFEEG